ncbi:FAA hydrolase family protein [Peribacillus cavernae]|uniref:FAA hydrolase family protein n=1 Tax=Peribacillus cavernae TaxID=1674310 RepID=A0A3S0U3C0_9BACI|nr:fumarylacetoacetate hydrolase family protein [Peribacillus cavernae]MDQ0217566.1 2-keto-4-pentenoate hydratase/2-oxohepta-3-ene-1,7-dioic acid hydratase in catechol pathway [Peribacillus cavernae]RUQ30000.1 FAA hydrolase family protein [Peribacillus cavernae]
MKFATVKVNNESKFVMTDEKGAAFLLLEEAAKKMNDSAVSIPTTLMECIQEGESFVEKAEKLYQWSLSIDDASLFIAEEDLQWEAPIPRPAKNIFCVGKNYAEHAIELGSEADIPENIMLFSKAPTTVIAHKSTIPNHQDVTDELDYEGELAVVIGKKGRVIKREEALDYVFGYTIINDVTARDLQARHKQYLLGKSLDGTCPMGPYIVHKSVVANPNQLQIQTKVNDEVRQKSSTEQFIFPVEEIIAVISKGMTLEPGDIIATGTPAGVGKGFNPPKFLHPGDTVEITVEKVGTLVNVIE